MKRTFHYLILLSIFFFASIAQAEDLGGIRYVPIGDSYTLGSGVKPAESWPILLTNHLQSDGIPIQLIDNPAQGGWTSELALKKELLMFKNTKPNFSTLMIGVNDWVQGVDEETFRANVSQLMDAMLRQVKDNKRMVVINIPDFSCTPRGAAFARGRNMQGLVNFNQIIQEESDKRELPVVDIYPVSQYMCKDPSFTSPDGLHPSAKGYLLWEEAIYPVVKKLLENEVKFISVNPPKPAEENMSVVIETNRGNIEVKLFPDLAPKTVENFKGLVQKGYYNGTIFHRVIKQFMIQGGDPTGTGRGGESIWGKKFADEVTPKAKFDRAGLLAMANAGPNTNGSQFFITTAATPWLNMKHTIFGEVTSGYDIVTAIEQSPADGNDRPNQEQKIIRASIKE